MLYKTYRTYRSENRGQALLELVIVMAVLVLLLVALVSLVILSLSTIQKSRLRARASGIAQDGIENIRRQRESTSDWDAFRDSCGSMANTWAWPGVDTSGYTAQAVCVTPTPGGGSQDKVIVETQTNWDFGGRSYNVTLETEFGPRGEGIFR